MDRVRSRYLRTREKSGWVVVYHELHPDPVYFRSEAWQEYLSCPDAVSNIHGFLEERGLLVGSQADDDAEYARVADKLMRKLSEPTILYLMLAQGCNFACSYCPIPGMAARYGETLLTPEDAAKGVRLWNEHLREHSPDDSRFLIFYGGEPLLNKPTFASVLADIEKLKRDGELATRNLNLMLATNGSLVDEDVLDLCVRHEILVAVGLDGPAAINDRHRRLAVGGGTYEKIVGAVTALRRRGVKVAVSASLTPENVGKTEDVIRVYQELGVEKFGFNFMKGRAAQELVPEGGREAFERAAISTVLEGLWKYGAARYEYQSEKKVSAFRARDFFPVDCTCYGNQLVIQPDGQVSNCPFYKANLGHVSSIGKEFRIAKTTVVTEWRKRLPLYHPDFRDVDAKALCGSGCAWGSLDADGHPYTVERVTKIFSEEAFNEIIWSELDRSSSGC
ncbi:MAG: radical SAM protein [Candidatus Uhrbacteria bacterium]